MDRNCPAADRSPVYSRSLSARRAWIEMGVHQDEYVLVGSLSARRAWIEILGPRLTYSDHGVALRKESVDRNFYYLSFI